jgi:hypothetical protein
VRRRKDVNVSRRRDINVRRRTATSLPCSKSIGDNYGDKRRNGRESWREVEERVYMTILGA